MKKYLIVLFLFMVVFTGCSSSTSKDSESDEEELDENDTKHSEHDDYGENDDLILQLTKSDEQEGVTKEDGKYQQIMAALRENPKLGEENEFNIFTISVGHTENGQKLLLAGINRFPKPVQNVSFDLTLQSEDGEYVVYEDVPIDLAESEMGAFEPNGVMPVLLDLTNEQYEQYNHIDPEEAKLELNNFEYEIGE